MSYRINTNITAMTAFRSLSSTGADLGKSITRLSTGMRINNGADDPAGLIAAEGYRKQISGLDAAMRNNQDALNFAKTADGALDEVSRLLRDARSLAVANGNSSLSAEQKQSNQTQLNNILTSIDRIASTTSFGSRKLLNGSSGTVGSVADSSKVQSAFVSGTLAGAAMTADGTLDINVTTAAEKANVAGTVTYAGTTSTMAGGTFSINGFSFSVGSGDTVQQVLDKINGAAGNTGVSASFGSGVFNFSTGAYGSDQKITFTEGSGGLVIGANTSASDAGVDAVATVTYNYGTNTATAAFSSGKGLNVKDAYGNSLVLTVGGGASTGTITAGVQVTAGQSSFQLGANGGDTANLNLSNYSSASLSLSGLDITGNSVQSALGSLDSAIATVSASRGSIGSFMKNTVESNMRAMSVAKENLSSTLSELADIDVADEMTNYTKLQILQQSGLAMLAQANSAPQGVLSLLR